MTSTKLMIPRPGDVVEVINDNYYASNAKTGRRGVITSSEGWHGADEVMFVFSASAFRERGYVSCSGGPCPVVKASALTYGGTTTQRFWRWIDRPRAGGGEDYDDIVNLWYWAPPLDR